MRVALVALVVLLAGCPAFGGAQQSTTTLTPVAVPEVPEYPPGVGPTGVRYPAELAGAHSAVVENTSYTIVSNRTITARDGEVRSLLSVRIRLAENRSYLVSARTGGPDGPLFLGRPPSAASYWSNGSVYLRALPGPDGPILNRFTPPNAFVGTWRYWRSTVAFGGEDGYDFQTFLGLFGAIPTDLAAVETVDGTETFRVVGTESLDPGFAKAGSGPVTNVSLSATITERGVVRGFDLRYDRRVDGRPARVRWSLRYENVGSTTVGGPPWPGALSAQEGSTTSTATSS